MDATTAQPTLLSAARNFMRKSAGTAALVIAPLAAVALAPAAKAQTVALNPPGSFGLGSGLVFSNGSAGSSGFFSSSVPQLGDIVGAKQGVNATFVFGSGAGFSGNAYVYFPNTTFTGTIPAATNIPVAYSFDLATTGSVTINSVQLLFSFADNSIADYSYDALNNSGTGTGTFAGSYSGYSAGYDFDGSNGGIGFYYLSIGYDQGQMGDTISLTMNPATQGIALNATAIPEPSTYAALAGLAALGLAIVRRHRLLARAA